MHRTYSLKALSDCLEDLKVFGLPFLAQPPTNTSLRASFSVCRAEEATTVFANPVINVPRSSRATPATNPSDESASRYQEPSIFIFTKPFPGSSDHEHGTILFDLFWICPEVFDLMKSLLRTSALSTVEAGSGRRD
ncbi:hypothetical protein ACJRO7_034255 [Eucalyptus globulus]|uniref:Uncharacterized protein n=1 Tax=Eucalyptus globulus TaxID=34317 RepID=A0ABD3J2G8_EUCGL